MGFRFLHLADCHLETSFGGRPETRERLRRATREAFERALSLSAEFPGAETARTLREGPQ